MNKLIRPRLGRWSAQGLPTDDRHVVICIHGILSDSSTFVNFLRHVDALDRDGQLDFWLFDYDYRQPIAQSADQLADAIKSRAYGARRVDLIGHSMGGLVARLAILRNRLPHVQRVVTLATPNHGTISGAQLNLLGQMTSLSLRQLHPIYPRAAGIFDLTDIHRIMRDALEEMYRRDPTRLDGKSYVSIPAQYYHYHRQYGEELPSTMMRGVSVFRKALNFLPGYQVRLNPVHDGIVEERSNRIHPAPAGSSDEGKYMPSRSDAAERILHATHLAGADCDHVTITSNPEIADLVHALLRAKCFSAEAIDPWLAGPPGRVELWPPVP